jgi:hypothetical protein
MPEHDDLKAVRRDDADLDEAAREKGRRTHNDADEAPDVEGHRMAMNETEAVRRVGGQSE